ncbi:pentapeptide repeat-containing protein [Tolypothrix sp. VBCCA 56010]|uniref:pentapeptide repeat-containing protein n=1 Tax=Tolypothrix sp. VBCCA 56010 TaxID=3137731 RepID=UPI003D7C4E9D
MNFFEASLVDTDLSGATLQRVNLTKANMRTCNLSGAIVKDSHLLEAILDEANLSGASFTDTNLSRASLIKANLSNADLTGADLSDCNLRQAFLKGAVFVNCKIAGICLWDVDLKAIKRSHMVDVSTPDKNDITKDDLAWALFCNLRHQQPEMFASSNLIKLLDSEQEVIRIVMELVGKYGGISPGDNSRLYVKTYNFTNSYRIYQSSDLLEVTVSDESRYGVILRVNNGNIDSNLIPSDVDTLRQIMDSENSRNS